MKRMIVVYMISLSGVIYAGYRVAARETNTAFRVERSEVVYSDGYVVPRSLKLYPLTSPLAGVAFEQRVTADNTKNLRIHFVIEDGSAPGGWYIECLDSRRNSVWKSSPEKVRFGQFWSSEIPGDAAIVLVYVTSPTSSPRIKIDKLAVTGLESKPQAITTSRKDIVPIGDQSQKIRTLGTSVARLRFIGDDGKRYFCTGFLVGGDLLLTNEHCFTTHSEAQSAVADFDFDTQGSTPTTIAVDDLMINDFDLDYAVVQLATVPSGHLPLTLVRRNVVRGNDLLVIHHPLGEFKQVSIINCQVSQAAVLGRGTGMTDIAHLCNTLGGSSGSPVMDRVAGTVVGLHHFGFIPGDSSPSNQAVAMRFILDHIKTHNPTVYSQLKLAD